MVSTVRTGSESEQDVDGGPASVATAGDGTPGEASADQVSLGYASLDDAKSGSDGVRDDAVGDNAARAEAPGDGARAQDASAGDAAGGDGSPAPRSPVAPMQRRFRLPTSTDPAPESNKLLGMCLWAAALGLIGLIPGGRLAVAVVLDSGPGWYSPVALALGMLGLAAIGAGFAAIHLPRLPWQLFGFASFLLVVNLILVYTAL
jgi:hypothetical protein